MRQSRWGSSFQVYFYFMLIGWARQEYSQAAKGRSTLQLAAEQERCHEIRTAASFISKAKWQTAALLPSRSCFHRPVDMGLNMHWSDSAAPLCTCDSFFCVFLHWKPSRNPLVFPFLFFFSDLSVFFLWWDVFPSSYASMHRFLTK